MRRAGEPEQQRRLAADDLGNVQEFGHRARRQHVRLVDQECDAGAATAVDQPEVWTASFVGSDAVFVLDTGDGAAGVAVDRWRGDVDVGVGGSVAHQASKLAEQNGLPRSTRPDQHGPLVGRASRIEIVESRQCALHACDVRLPARQVRRCRAW